MVSEGAVRGRVKRCEADAAPEMRLHWREKAVG
jgi:hypothetical protein